MGVEGGGSRWGGGVLEDSDNEIILFTRNNLTLTKITIRDTVAGS